MTENQDLEFHHLIESPLLPETPLHVTSSSTWIVGATALGALAVLAYAARRHTAGQPSGNPEEPSGKFTSENLTASFVAAIPTITRELNLETATATQTETFTQSNIKTTLWGLLDLGTSTAQVRVPVTYRYHICLREPWELKPEGAALIVIAPGLRASLPPAIQTDRMEKLSMRGWCRGTPHELLAELERQITPAISERAIDPRQLDLIRPACRLAVAEFVRLWLEREGQWHSGGFTSIQVRFADEAALPFEPTLRLLE